MRQLQFDYQGQTDLITRLSGIREESEKLPGRPLLFHIYTEVRDISSIRLIRDTIHEYLPRAQVCGALTDGTIRSGVMVKNGTSIICTIFEEPDAKVQVHFAPLDAGSDQKAGQHVVSVIRRYPWVKGVEMLIPLQWRSMVPFLECFEQLPEEMEIFGGGAFTEDLLTQEAFVVPDQEDITGKGAVFILYGGERLHIKTDYIIGWKPLGRKMIVTKAEGSRLCELDHVSAFSIYHRYLHVEKNDFNFDRALEFPFLYTLDGISVLRAPVQCRDDDSLDMTSDIVEGVPCRLAYGDPATILNSVQKGGELFVDFQPQAVNLYSCAARRTFWGNNDADKETKPFEGIGSSSGFYTSGEILRKNGHLTIHNMTLVVAAMREGDADPAEKRAFLLDNTEMSRQASLIVRFANFVNVAIADLEEANRHLDYLSKRDGLTDLLNRREIQNQILAAFAEQKRPELLCAIMIDIDNFKQINDTYGHREGDQVLQVFSSRMQQLIDREEPGASVGRWGGEEFMIFLPGADMSRSANLAEKIRVLFSSIDFPLAGHQTASLGVCQAREDESADAFISRIDSCLYDAKRRGKNQVFAG